MNLQNIIEKALVRTEGVPNNHERAARIVDFIEIARELAGEPTSDIGRGLDDQSALLSAIRQSAQCGQVQPERSHSLGMQVVEQSQRPPSNLIVLPGQEEPDSIPRMMTSGQLTQLPVTKSKEPVMSVQQIEAYLQRVAPSYIDVVLDPEQPPVRYSRKIKLEEAFFGEDNRAVTLSYPDKYDNDCPGYVFTTSDSAIDVEAAVRECTAVAMNRYSLSKEPKVVAARPAKKWVPDLDGVLANGVGADAPEGDYAANANAFRNPSPVLTPRF